MLLTYAQIETALLRRFAHVIDDDEIVDLQDLLFLLLKSRKQKGFAARNSNSIVEFIFEI